MSAISDAEFYLSSFGHCHHDPLASKKIIEDLLKELKADKQDAERYRWFRVQDIDVFDNAQGCVILAGSGIHHEIDAICDEGIEAK